MAAPPFKVKASFPYESAHEDDLNFSVGQIITVTREEDADWFEGQYTDPTSGEVNSGLFPKNFVEKYEPAPPPRPVRAGSSKPLPAPKQEEIKPTPTEVVEDDEEEEDVASPISPAAASVSPVAQQAPAPIPEQPKAQAAPKAAEPPVKAAQPPSSSKSPPPVAEKPSSFKDRIAAFNKASAPPIAPFKPAALGSSNFIKKPFVAPPPSRDAYVPPVREQAVTKIYRRDEDPEIAERQAQDFENAEKAGLVPPGEDENEEEAPKAVSLKERIALLQKQQMEQAARRQDVAVKEKPKKPPKKRVEQEPEESIQAESLPRGSSDMDRGEVESRKIPRSMKPTESIISDGNEADQSAAGETTEADVSTGVEEEDTHQHHAVEPPADEEGDEEEEEEDDDMDEESKRQLALRARMAKLSGGMGMPGMFGPPGGMPMMGMTSNPKKKKVDRSLEQENEATSPISAPRVPVIPMPALNRAQTTDSAEDTTRPDDDDVEDDELIPLASPPPLPAASKPKIERAPTIPTTTIVQSPSPGSESDDEMPGNSQAQDPSAASSPPARPPVPPSAPSRRSTAHEIAESPTSISDQRQSRGPPPPIPTAIPPVPTRAGKVGADGESEYEGDYDTDIASGAKHKDALKSHARESSIDDMSTFAEDTPVRPVPLPPVPAAHSRAAPPLPPQPPKVPPRASMDTPRAPPPLPPSVPAGPPVPPRAPTSSHDDDDEDYDPFRYGGVPNIPRSPPAVPNAPSAFAPPVPGPPPPLPRRDEEEDEEKGEEEEEDDRYSHPVNRPPPPLPPQQAAAPASESPTTSPRMASSEFSSPKRARQSFDNSRRSVDQPGRASVDRQGYIATDVDLGKSSQWWTQPARMPPVFQGRTDVLFETEESSTSKRGGKTIVSIDVYVLFHDYSQTIISARFDAKNPSDASVEQRHEPPPAQPLRQDQLETAYSRFGEKIAQVANTKQNTTVGDGSPEALVQELFKGLSDTLLPVGTRAYGAAVYSNLANATVQQFDEIRPGDIVSFRNAKFQGKHGGMMHQKYSMDVGKPDHVGVVTEWDGTKKKVRALEQGRDGKKCKIESFRLGDLRSGEVRVWRVMGRDWVGWGESQ